MPEIILDKRKWRKFLFQKILPVAAGLFAVGLSVGTARAEPPDTRVSTMGAQKLCADQREPFLKVVGPDIIQNNGTVWAKVADLKTIYKTKTDRCYALLTLETATPPSPQKALYIYDAMSLRMLAWYYEDAHRNTTCFGKIPEFGIEYADPREPQKTPCDFFTFFDPLTK